MPLEDLIVDKAQVTTELIETILRGRVELVKENEAVHLTREADALSTKTKLLLYLTGQHAWDLITVSEGARTSPTDDIGKEVGIEGSTLRGALKVLRDEHLAASDGGRYRVLPRGIRELEGMIESSVISGPPSSKPNRASRPRGRSTRVRSFGRPEVMDAIVARPFSEETVTSMMPLFRALGNQQRYLLIIYLARQEMGIAGLTPAEVNYLLTEPPIGLPARFYVSNISRDLGSKLRGYVNPYRAGKAYEYRLNTPGTEYVESLINGNAG
jgi:hypothetical protein